MYVHMYNYRYMYACMHNVHVCVYIDVNVAPLIVVVHGQWQCC